MEIEKMSLLEIINHPKFRSLRPVEYPDGQPGPAMWEIEMNIEEYKQKDGHYFFQNTLYPFGWIRFYKLKNPENR